MMELWAIWMITCSMASILLGQLMAQMLGLFFTEMASSILLMYVAHVKIHSKFDCYFVSLVLQQATQKYVSSNLANPKLMNNTMASIKIRMPDIETQKRLSKVFQALDGCLFIRQRTYEMYQREKQYLLRQMFI